MPKIGGIGRSLSTLARNLSDFAITILLEKGIFSRRKERIFSALVGREMQS